MLGYLLDITYMTIKESEKVGWFKSMLTKVAIKFLNVQPAMQGSITIQEAYTYEANLIRNKLWYRGEAYELEQFFKNISSDPVNQSRFWCATPSENLSIRKIHSGLPGMLIDKLTDIVVSDIDQIQVEDSETLNSLWKDISEDNKFNEVLSDSIQKALVSGDGAFKLSIDTDISKYPIIEFFDGDRVEYIHNRGRLSEIHFKTSYTKKSKKYTLVEMYGLGYIKYKLLDDRDNEVSLDILDETKELEDIEYKDKFIMAIPLMFFKSSKWEGRGKSIIDNKSDSFDALDEVISQWIDAIRAGRVQKYIPENLLPVDPNTGKILKPNPFDNNFIAVSSNAGEDAKNQIDMKQADIKFEAYVESYSNAIDMCLQGIISPSTLGIDLKKTDNAEAQREKEKTTLYTRNKMIDTLTEVIPELVNIILKTYDVLNNKSAGEYEVSISFGEYSTPSFDSVVETVGKAKTLGIMSLQKCIDELYGDTMTEEEKALEIARIKEESGIYTTDEPSTAGEDEDNLDNLDVDINE